MKRGKHRKGGQGGFTRKHGGIEEEGGGGREEGGEGGRKNKGSDGHFSTLRALGFSEGLPFKLVYLTFV